MTNSPPTDEPPEPRRRPHYNEMYEQLVQDTDDIVGMVAYALYKRSKRAWIVRFEEEERRRPTPEEVFQRYVRAQGDFELERLRHQAGSVLDAYSEVVVEREAPAIINTVLEGAALTQAREALKAVNKNTKWYKSWGTGVLAAFTYTLLLLVGVVIANILGVDLLGVIERLGLRSS